MTHAKLRQRHPGVCHGPCLSVLHGKITPKSNDSDAEAELTCDPGYVIGINTGTEVLPTPMKSTPVKCSQTKKGSKWIEAKSRQKRDAVQPSVICIRGIKGMTYHLNISNNVGSIIGCVNDTECRVTDFCDTEFSFDCSRIVCLVPENLGGAIDAGNIEVGRHSVLRCDERHVYKAPDGTGAAKTVPVRCLGTATEYASERDFKWEADTADSGDFETMTSCVEGWLKLLTCCIHE